MYLEIIKLFVFIPYNVIIKTDKMKNINTINYLTAIHSGKEKNMKKTRKLAIVFALCGFILLPILPVCKARAAELLPKASNNLNVGLKSYSRLTVLDSGYMRVFYDGEKIRIEYYDDNFNIQSKKSLDMELSIWGGFYAGRDAYYIVEGQANTEENDTAEVVRVIQYDTDWNKTGTANITGNSSLFGGEVRYPFRSGCVEMTEYNGTLYIVTGHEGYVDAAYNQGHQGFLMLEVDEASMTGNIVVSDLWHSFAQYVACRNSDLYVLEQSEGSRYTKLTKYDTENLKKVSLPVFKYGGTHTSAWAISCYASVDDMAVSSDNVLCLGTSIDQSGYDSVSSDTAHNIYLTVTPTSDFTESATKVKWLTDYSGGGKCFIGTKITKINENRFLVSWEEFEEERTADTIDSLSASMLHYVFIDGAGNRISEEFTEAAPISDCHPVVKGSNVVYYASNANMVNFYAINAETGEFSKRVYRVAGENAIWSLDDGVLTISGTGEMSMDMEPHYRAPVSTSATWISYLGGSVWGAVSENVKKIIIRQGITDIPGSAFESFRNLTEAEIESGVKSIGEKAFYGCDALKKITIPASVTSIGEDFLWTGAYWISDESHVVRATICAPQDSYAAQYAKENNISYTSGEQGGEKDDNQGNNGQGNNSQGNTSQGNNNQGNNKGNGKDNNNNDKRNVKENDNTNDEVSIEGAKITGVKKSYAYNGRKQTPNVTIILDNIKLKEGTDYTVTYRNNKSTGKATIEIEGIYPYYGTIQKTFRIVPKKAVVSKVKSPKARTLKVTWKKDSQADGYQIQYAGNSRFTSGRKNVGITRKSTVSKKISRLIKGRKYYVRIRAYKKIDGKKCYGSWSRSMRVKSN